MTLKFKKYKFTYQLFSKSIDFAQVKMFDDRFEVQIMPFLNYSGKYYNESINQKTTI